MKGLPAQDAAASWCRLLEWDVRAGSFSVVMVGAPGHHRVLSSIPDTYSTPNQNCVVTCALGSRSPLVENHCLIIILSFLLPSLGLHTYMYACVCEYMCMHVYMGTRVHVHNGHTFACECAQMYM